MHSVQQFSEINVSSSDEGILQNHAKGDRHELKKVHSFDDYSVTLSVYLTMNARAYSLSVPEAFAPFSAPNYKKNQDAARIRTDNGLRAYADQSDCCVLCGKLSITGGTFVMLSNVGEYITAEEYNDSDDLGLYPIGSDCLKKLKPFGVPIYDGKGKKVSK